MRKKLSAILNAAPNQHAALFAVQLLASPPHIRDEWFAVGYRFPWECDR